MKRFCVVLAFLFSLAACYVHAGEPVDKSWTAAPAAYKMKDAKLDPAVELTKTGAVLDNRGLMLSKAKFTKNIKLAFTWEWKLGDDKMSYQDVLTVAVRTTGKQLKFPSELEDGLCIRFAAHAKTISIELREKGKDSVLIARVPATFDRGKEYKIKILCKPDFVQVHVGDGPPVLEAKTPLTSGELVGIHNRESGGGKKQKSVISDLTLEGN